jgi:hypothetical protein
MNMPYCTQQDLEQRIGVAQLRQLTNDTWDVAAPVATATPHASGSLSGTFKYVVTALNDKGETIKSNEVTFTSGGSNFSVTISYPAIATATSYKIYKSATTGVYTSPCLLVHTTALSYLDDGTVSTLLVGAPPTDASIPDATIVSAIIAQSDREIDGKAGQVWTVPFTVPDNCVSIPSIVKQISIVFSLYYCFLRRFSETDVPKQWIELYKKMCDNLEAISNQEIQLDGMPTVASSEADIVAPDKQLDFADPNSPLNMY